MKALQAVQLFVGLLVLCNLTFLAKGQFPLQNGKVNFTVTHPALLYCSNVRYPRAFSSPENIRVLASISHGKESVSVHDSAVVWTSHVTQSRFRVCVLESGQGTNASAVVNWIAFRGTPSGMLDGTASFSTFTSGTKCERVNFAQSFSSVPKVLATVRHSVSTRPQDAMNMWIEELNENYFRICLREVKTFDGKHQNLQADWLAFTEGGDALTFQGKLQFENTGAPLEQDNFAFCKVHNFTEEFYAPPVVMAIANHLYDSTNEHSTKPENNVINTWIEEVTISSFRVCVKDMAGMESQHDNVTVDYAVIGDLDPCINVSCDYFAVCKAIGLNETICSCDYTCSSFKDPVCSSNGTTYDNECMFQREMCYLRANFTIYHPGDCTGFPSQKGRHSLRRIPSWAEAICDQVPLAPDVFYPDKPVHVQFSVNHINFSDPSYVHEAVVPWVEEVNGSNFTVCVTQAGRNEKTIEQEFATVDWLAYQGAPDGGVSGGMDMPTWWTGTNCRIVSLPPSKFKSTPTVLVSAEHERRGVKHDASSVWVEDLTTTSFKICIRELQNFDGAHQSIHVDWIAFEELHRPLFREHGSIYFANANKLSKEFNYAFCQDIGFTKHYNDTPEVLVTANHSTNGGNLNPLYNSISAWVEYINETGFRACVKELFVNQHDPLSISYAVMPDVCEPGLSFYFGYCYYSSEKCETWTNASTICRSMGANLPAIESQEENVYVQHRHHGNKAWIGLNDIATEGLFTWVDGSLDKFRYWAKKQPNDLMGEDCVHTLGAEYGYKWNDVDCAACHQYTCKKDYDDCASTPCQHDGTCVNGKRSFSCICPPTHSGPTCEEFNECSSSPCLNGGTCTDGINNYTCSCPAPYFGKQCQDEKKCHSYPCQNGGTCVEEVNGFRCLCPNDKAGAMCQELAEISCKNHQSAGRRSSGTYYLLKTGDKPFQVYCDMSSNGGGWTLISRFSNADSKNWMLPSGNWWYDRTSSYGSVTSTTNNYDMISPAFWLVTGHYIKITRSDDSTNTALLYTSSCMGGRTFRSFMTQYGNFRNGATWNSNACRGSCYAHYGGSYLSTAGFREAQCSSNLKSSNYLSFWCDWSSGDGSVMMIGGGGDNCNRADHGIGITEENEAKFSNNYNSDFGDLSTPSSYSLNLWIK